MPESNQLKYGQLFPRQRRQVQELLGQQRRRPLCPHPRPPFQQLFALAQAAAGWVPLEAIGTVQLDEQWTRVGDTPWKRRVCARPRPPLDDVGAQQEVPCVAVVVFVGVLLSVGLGVAIILQEKVLMRGH